MLSKSDAMLPNFLCSLSHFGNIFNVSQAIDDDNHIAVIVFAMFCFVAMLYDTDNVHRIFSFMKRFCLCLARAAMCVLCVMLLFGHALVVLCTIIHNVGLGVVLSTATTITFVVEFVTLVISIVAWLLLVLYRLLRMLISCIQSIRKLFLFRLVGAVILLVGMAVSGLADVWLGTVIHGVGLAKVFFTATVITLVVAIVVLVITIVVSVVVVVHRLLCKFANRSTQNRTATPVDCQTDCIPSTKDCVATPNPVRRQSESIRFDINSVCAIPKEGDDKIFKVNFSPYSTVYIVEKWNPGLGQEYSAMVVRNYLQVQMEQNEVQVQFEEPAQEEQEQVEEIVVLPTAQPPAPRRSSRLRRKPDRWVPTSGRSVKLVPVGSYFQAGVRRSGRIAARMAVQ